MKEKVDVTGVPETMLQTLYARAKETKKSEMSWPVETVSGKMFYLDGAHCKTTDAAAENPEEKGACGTGDSCGNGVRVHQPRCLAGSAPQHRPLHREGVPFPAGPVPFSAGAED